MRAIWVAITAIQEADIEPKKEKKSILGANKLGGATSLKIDLMSTQLK